MAEIAGQAQLDRMSIMGVRSFGTSQEVIQFFTPLTLIVGQNGSGKTTIIECLKYACSGLMPPNTKTGGAFIHDPQLVGEKEVLAQIRLKFRSAQGHEMTVTRSMQLTVTKTARKFKSLDSHLNMKKDGNRVSTSTRVMEIDSLIPLQLGLSRAILDNVIFCHQEESLWPMSEPSVLKKRFDEIFEAEKYTKAIDNIKVMRKKQNEQLAQFKIHEQHAKEDKLRGEKAEKRMTQLAKEIEDMREQATTVAARMSEADRQSQNANDKSAQFVVSVEKLKSKRANIESKQDYVDDLRSTMHEMQDSTEDLEQMHNQYDERVQQYKNELDTTTNRWHSLAQQIDQGRKEEGTKRVDHGRFQAEQDSFERQITNRDELVKESARQRNIRGYDHDLDHEQVMNFIERIAKMAKDQNSTLERARRETQENIREVQDKLDGLREQRTLASQRRETAKQQIASNDRKIKDFRRTVDRVDVDEGRQAAVESTVSDIQAKLTASQASLQDKNWSQQVNESQSRVASLEFQAEKLQKEMVQAADRAGSASELNRLKRVLKETKLRLQTNKGAQSSRINELVGADWSDATLEQLYDSSMLEKTKAVRDAEQQRDGTSRELEQLDVKLRSLRDDLKRNEKEVASTRKQICNVIDGDDPSSYPSELAKLEQDRESVATDTAGSEAWQKFWKQIRSTFEKKHMCRVCLRSFDDGEDPSSFLENIKKQLEAKENANLQDDLKIADEQIAATKAVGSAYERWKRLTEKDVPEVKREIERLEPTHRVLIEKLDKKDQVVNDRVSSRSEAESLSKAVKTIVQDVSLAKNTEEEIESLTAKQSADQTGRSPDEINEESSKTQQQLRSARDNLSKLQSERDKVNGEVHRLEIELRDTKSKLQTILGQLKEKSAMTAQIAELSSANEEQRANMRQCESEVDAVNPQLAQVEAQLDDIRKRRDAKEKEMREEASALTNCRDRLELANRDIQAYLAKNGPEQLANHEQVMQQIRDQIQQLEEEQQLLTRDLNKLKEQERNHEETKRQIMENLRFRKNLHELEVLGQEVAALEEENAEADRQYWTREADKWTSQRNTLATEQASLIGEMKSKDNELERHMAEWETDGKGAAKKYKEANIKVEATKAVVDDLGRYGGALDKAVMHYHSLKMEQINRVIDELWRRTYQGTDVDTVLIKSESEGGRAKSHNYRVCMIKQDAEMDMRGRCSAGQKVLACIIIRLALAECFGSNCGIIALDEPTTNLDRDNIKALAESLHNIIQNRKAQKNFQLIVITHDEDFLKNMHCQDHVDNYFRVGRNPEQKSEIKRQRIQDISF